MTEAKKTAAVKPPATKAAPKPAVPKTTAVVKAAPPKTAVVKISKDTAREIIKRDLRWLQQTIGEGERRWMRLASAVTMVKTQGWWRGWEDAKGEAFKTFDDWLAVDCADLARSKVYALIGVVENLAGEVSEKRLEEIGRSRAYELSRLAKEKPKALPALLEQLKKDPEMSVAQVKGAVAAALEGRHLDSGKYQQFELSVPIEDVPTVKKCFALMQAQHGGKNPDGASALGRRLVDLCMYYLSAPAHKDLLKQMEAKEEGKAAFAVEA
jgi:hypothetical protein